MKIYLAAPFGTKKSAKRKNVDYATTLLREKGFEVYCPCEYSIPNAWDYPNSEWALMVFANDVYAIDNCDIVVMLDYGRDTTTAGTNWEVGYAFGRGKKVICVEMTDSVVSLMVANGSYARVKGLQGLCEYDFDTMPKCRTSTEQK